MATRRPIKFKRSLEKHTDSVSAVKFSPNGRYLASTSNDGTIVIWMADSGDFSHSLSYSHAYPLKKYGTQYQKKYPGKKWGEPHGISDIAWSQDSRYIAAAINDFTLRVWDRKTRELVATFVGHKDIVFCCNFHPKMKYVVASGSFDTTVRIWNFSDVKGKLKKLNLPIDHGNDWISTVCYNSDGSNLVAACCNGYVYIYDANNNYLMKKSINMGRINPDNTQISFAKYTPDGQYIVVACHGKPFAFYNVTSAQFEPSRSDGKTCSKEDNQFDNKDFSIIADFFQKKYLVSGSEDGSIWFWDVPSGQKVLDFKTGHNQVVVCCACHPTKPLVATGSLDRTVKLWEVNLSPKKRERESNRTIQMESTPLILDYANYDPATFNQTLTPDSAGNAPYKKRIKNNEAICTKSDFSTFPTSTVQEPCDSTVPNFSDSSSSSSGDDESTGTSSSSESGSSSEESDDEEQPE